MNRADNNVRRILVVDDNESIHKDFELILSGERTSSRLEALEAEIFGGTARPAGPACRYKLDFALQGEEGVEKVRAALKNGEDPFQLAFVDMRMPPGWDGVETTSRLWKLDARIQVVLCSAYSDYSWEELSGRLGDTGNLLILKKPFDISEAAQMAGALTSKWILAREAEAGREQLEELVACRTRELEQANIKLRQALAERKQFESQLIRAKKMEAVGTMAAGVAHDLNNILAGIVSYPDLMLMQLDPGSPFRRPLSIIKNSGEKAAAIVRDMLTLARLGVIARSAVDLKAIIAECLRSPEYLNIMSYHPGVRVETILQNGPAVVIGSAVHLASTLMNLLSNAAEAISASGTITISLSRTCRKIPGGRSGNPAEGEWVLLSVRDTGAGIEEEEIEHVFEPFYTKKKMGRSGTGLGMAVVWGTVKDHGGHIEVQSRVNQGTTFDLFFPATNQCALAAAGNEPQKLPLGHGERILVVDDLAEQRKIAAEMLAQLGYQVFTAGSGEEALDCLARTPADLVLLDMIMDPGIDGLETYRRIIERHRAQKTIFASGYSESDRILMAERIGSGVFLRKPYSMYDIAIAVSRELSHSTALN